MTLDGVPLVRGSDRDYVIDYVRGTVTFTYRRLVTAESTIVVEFEEGEGAYGRTVIGGGPGPRRRCRCWEPRATWTCASSARGTIPSACAPANWAPTTRRSWPPPATTPPWRWPPA